jgi:hypothetical protein
MDINQIIKERFKVLPANIQQAITSTDLASKFEKIAKTHELHIDQNSNLQTETILVMLGLETVDNFLDNIEKGLEISRERAILVAKDVNTEIIDNIRVSLRKIQEQQEANEILEPTITRGETISSLEKVGNLTIEQNPISSSSQYKEEGIDKTDILKGIESPTIPMVDHLLENHINSPAQIEVKKVEEKKAYTADPYREQI